MTYHVFMAQDHMMIGTASPLIKSDERSEFTSAIALMDAVSALRNAAEAEAQTRHDEAYEVGLAKGYSEAQAQIAKLIEDMSERFEAVCAERRADIAEAALAATKSIIGKLDDVDVTKRLVSQALVRIDNNMPLTIEVAPTMSVHIAEHVAHLSHVRVEPVEGLAALDCVFQTQKGRILAGLDLQITALGERWGVAAQANEYGEVA